MKKSVVFLLLLVMSVAGGCAAFAEENDLPPEQKLEEARLRQAEMERIAQEIGLEHARPYEDRVETNCRDAIVRLCQSESGRYTAYGFISPQYGRMGVLITNQIDGVENWNEFDDYVWNYGGRQPTLTEEDDGYIVLFTYTQGDGSERTVRFDTFDTGTMLEHEKLIGAGRADRLRENA